MAKLIKQPLLHFLVAGILIFAGYQWSAPAVSDIENLEKVIPVDRLALLNFMQFRAQAFQPELFSEQLDAMSESDLEKLIDDFVREEALYREALALGMDQGDYIIRQRLVQKVEFLLENMVNQSLVPDDAVIASWFDERRSDYQIDAVYTFTHIFFDAGERGGIGTDDFHTHVTRKHVHHLIAFVLAQQAIINKHAGQLIANCLVNQNGCDRTVDPP